MPINKISCVVYGSCNYFFSFVALFPQVNIQDVAYYAIIDYFFRYNLNDIKNLVRNHDKRMTMADKR